MPLHLLPKKSWNVYNTANIERVRRDEEAARVREEEKERRMQEEDAARRMAILRGEVPPPTQEYNVEEDDRPTRVSRKGDADEYSDTKRRKRRRIAGENDTDREMRWAVEDAAAAAAAPLHGERRKQQHPAKSDAPITDNNGHISLFPEPSKKKHHGSNTSVEKNPEYEAEAAKQKQRLEDQYTMRFANAGGFGEVVKETPWYQMRHSGALDDDVNDAEAEKLLQAQGKDAWGNTDPRRREREKQRINSADPLAMMKMGVKKLREVEGERKRENEERKKDLVRLIVDQKQRYRSGARGVARTDDSLEGFSLDDTGASSTIGSREQRRHREGHKYRSRDAASESDRRHHRSHPSHRRSRSHSRDQDQHQHREHRHRHHHRRDKDRQRERDTFGETQRRQRQNSPYVG